MSNGAKSEEERFRGIIKSTFATALFIFLLISCAPLLRSTGLINVLFPSEFDLHIQFL